MTQWTLAQCSSRRCSDDVGMRGYVLVGASRQGEARKGVARRGQGGAGLAFYTSCRLIESAQPHPAAC